jgi:hypothetical protein
MRSYSSSSPESLPRRYASRSAAQKKKQDIVAKVSYYVYDKAGKRIANRSAVPVKTKFQRYVENSRTDFDDLRNINERKPIQRPITLEGRISKTGRNSRRRVYDSLSSDSSDDYVTLGKKLTTKLKVDKIPRPATKYLTFLERQGEDDLTDYEILKKKMEQRAALSKHKSFNSFYNSFAQKKKKDDASTGDTTNADTNIKRNPTVKSFKSDDKTNKGKSFIY